ncbi:hypothetical protein GCM10009733_087290 [Nonomuraea maheshkhaliensis]|uniref:Uncharacterized protein n=1 Tax=Nonomuraea maheshkhaliensis TaxID=419590 RepID=A0ABN2GU95_9ACTN
MALRWLYLIFIRLAGRLVLSRRSQRSKEAEILTLRHQFAVLCRQVARPQQGCVDRLNLRVLTRSGQVSDGFRWVDPDDDRDVHEVLRAEGLVFDEAVANQPPGMRWRPAAGTWHTSGQFDRTAE